MPSSRDSFRRNRVAPVGANRIPLRAREGQNAVPVGRAYSHRIPLAKLKCISPKRWEELAARRKGEEPGGAARVKSGRHDYPRSLFRSGA